MAARGWAHSTSTAIGIAAAAGAAQLGLAYGLGVISWQPVTDAAGDALWLRNLTWALWIAATSTALGAIYANGNGGLLTRARATTATGTTPAAPGPTASGRTRDGRAAFGDTGLAWRLTIVLAAAVGAVITVPLIMLPARGARRVDNFQPQVTAGAYVVVGIIAGLIIAFAAVSSRVIASNLLVSAAWVWGLAAVSAVDALRANQTAGTAQLGAWQFTVGGLFSDASYLPGALLMLGGALLSGVFAAMPADRRGDSRLGIAVSGAAGPLLIAAAYLLAVPRSTGRTDQLSPDLFAPYAVLAGLAGSALVAALGPLRPRRAIPVAAAPSAGFSGSVASVRPDTRDEAPWLPTSDKPPWSPPGDKALRSPPGDKALRSPPGDKALRSPPGDKALRSPPGDEALRSPRGDADRWSPAREDDRPSARRDGSGMNMITPTGATRTADDDAGIAPLDGADDTPLFGTQPSTEPLWPDRRRARKGASGPGRGR
ncbi:MAG: hypothetical protein QOE03_1219 [Micromonosporaceae bacterium]|nr:hypothetical protein [Micromonosporaceae bacterium]